MEAVKVRCSEFRVQSSRFGSLATNCEPSNPEPSNFERPTLGALGRQIPRSNEKQGSLLTSTATERGLRGLFLCIEEALQVTNACRVPQLA
jgi:hypothetical protein